MPETATDLLTMLVHNVDADDVVRELEKLDEDMFEQVWRQAIMAAYRVSEGKQERLSYILQCFVALSKPPAIEPRLTTRHALRAVLEKYEGLGRKGAQRVIDMVDRKERTTMTFDRYEAIATLVKYGNLYKTKNDRGDAYWVPKGEDVRYAITSEDEIEWMLSEGLADVAEYDPMLVLGKLVPNDKTKNLLENHGLTAESPGVGGHLSHCCLTRHGCKYSDEFCPVETKMFPPDYPSCGACDEDDAMDDETVDYLSSRAMINELESRGYTVTGSEEDEPEDAS